MFVYSIIWWYIYKRYLDPKPFPIALTAGKLPFSVKQICYYLDGMVDLGCEGPWVLAKEFTFYSSTCEIWRSYRISLEAFGVFSYHSLPHPEGHRHGGKTEGSLQVGVRGLHLRAWVACDGHWGWVGFFMSTLYKLEWFGEGDYQLREMPPEGGLPVAKSVGHFLN